MKLPQINLRDLFWLTLIVAGIVAWGIEHQGAMTTLRVINRSINVRSAGQTPPSKDAIARKALQEHFQSFHNDELASYLQANGSDEIRYQLCLTEMSRRGMRTELRELYDKLMYIEPKEQGFFDPPPETTNRQFPDNLQLLTALRRAQSLPDPIEVRVSLRYTDHNEDPYPCPKICAQIANVDHEKEAVYLSIGGDDRGGRRERCRIHLTSPQGQRIPDSKFFPWFGGGISMGGPLAYGEVNNWQLILDPRYFVAPPPSGTYQLEVVFSNDTIASEPDLTGLIVWKSKPLNVIVENRSQARRPRRYFSLLVTWSLLGLLTVAFVRGRLRPNRDLKTQLRIRGRDLCLAVLFAVLISVWTYDNLRLQRQIEATTPDQDANWTMRLADELSVDS